MELVRPEEVVVGVDEEEGSESDFPDIKLDEHKSESHTILKECA